MARKSRPDWRGSKAIHEQPDSPQWDYSKDGAVCVRVYEGPLGALRSFRATSLGYGATMQDLGEEGAGLTVRTARITPVDVGGEEGRGRLTVRLADRVTRGEISIGPEPEPGEVVDELEWQSLDKDIRYHKWFQDLTVTERGNVDAALELAHSKEESERTQAETMYNAFTARQQGLFVRLLRGQESYVTYVPVVRATTYSETKPTGSNAGTRQSPVNPGVSGTWEWLKTADRAVRRGGEGSLWERVEEWTGATEWDNVIYD